MKTSRAEFAVKFEIMLPKNWKGLQGTAPVAVSGDGICLFNYLSIAFLTIRLTKPNFRVRTSMEVCLNHEYIKGMNADNRLRGFHRTFATGMPTEDAYSSGHLVLSQFGNLGLASVLMLRLISPELALFPDFWISVIPWYFCFYFALTIEETGVGLYLGHACSQYSNRYPY